MPKALCEPESCSSSMLDDALILWDLGARQKELGSGIKVGNVSGNKCKTQHQSAHTESDGPCAVYPI